VLFVENATPHLRQGGMFNDGCGSASPDYNVLFNGYPTLRLDPQGNTTSSSTNSQQLTLGGSPQTLTAASSASFVTTSAQTGSPTVDTGGGYIVLNTPSSSGSWQTTSGNSAVLSYTSAVVSGTANNWTVTFSGTKLVVLPGSPDTSITTANIGTATCIVNNPNPHAGNSPNTSGTVTKRRIDDEYTGRFGNAMWFRPTSKSSASANTALISVSLYNRDGTNQNAARMMFQLAIGMNPASNWNNDNTLLWYLDNAAPIGGAQRYVPFAFTTKNAMSQHSWDPVGGSWDDAGVWRYVKVRADFSVTQYIDITVDGTVYSSMAGRSMVSISSTGAKSMHFSMEYAQTSGTRRFINLGKVVGTAE